MGEPIWFWQRIVSPHMAGLATALVARGRNVTYVAERPLSPERAAQGWRAPEPGAAQLQFAPDAEQMARLVAEAPKDSIHICQGFRGNGLVGIARKGLMARGLQQWVVMEKVDDAGWRGMLRRLEYGRLIRQECSRIEGVLAIGHDTPEWLTRRGMPAERVFPFTYFLPAPSVEIAPRFASGAPFQFLFVGQFVERKRLSMLLDSLERLGGSSFELTVIGAGPLEEPLRATAEGKLHGQVRWLGRQPQNEIPTHMAEADCLVLPSRHDGWGAVVSEALMAGTPAICSDRCGAAGVVRASGRGDVFPAGDLNALTMCLRNAIAGGRQVPPQRAALAAWARCLGAEAGASYLDAILRHAKIRQDRPNPLWEAAPRVCQSGANVAL